jgi:hypothetical protein
MADGLLFKSFMVIGLTFWSYRAYRIFKTDAE